MWSLDLELRRCACCIHILRGDMRGKDYISRGWEKRQNNGTLVTQKKEGNRSKEGRRPDGNRVYMCEHLWAQDSGRWAMKTGVWGQSGKQRKIVSKKHKQTKCKIKCKYAVSQLLPLRNIFIYEMQRIINLQHFFSNTVTIF